MMSPFEPRFSATRPCPDFDRGRIWDPSWLTAIEAIEAIAAA
jgi:hypothetical protein